MNKIHQIQTWLIEHTQDIVIMYYVEGQQKKALAYLAGGKNITTYTCNQKRGVCSAWCV